MKIHRFEIGSTRFMKYLDGKIRYIIGSEPMLDDHLAIIEEIDEKSGQLANRCALLMVSSQEEIEAKNGLIYIATVAPFVTNFGRRPDLWTPDLRRKFVEIFNSGSERDQSETISPFLIETLMGFIDKKEK